TRPETNALSSLVLLRQHDGLHHHALHLLSADERLKEHAELDRTEFQQFDHFGEILGVQRAPASFYDSAPTCSESQRVPKHWPRLLDSFTAEALRRPVPAGLARRSQSDLTDC